MVMRTASNEMEQPTMEMISKASLWSGVYFSCIAKRNKGEKLSKEMSSKIVRHFHSYGNKNSEEWNGTANYGDDFQKFPLSFKFLYTKKNAQKKKIG